MKVDFEDLVPKAKNGDQQALERIAIQLQHLVASWLIKNWYKSPSCYDFADMVQEGVIYGVLSVNTYKPEKGMKAFSWVWDNAYYRLATLVRNMHYDKRRANQGCVSLDAKIVSNRYGRDNDDTSFYKIIDKKVQEDVVLANLIVKETVADIENVLRGIEIPVFRDTMAGFKPSEIETRRHLTWKQVDNAKQRMRRKAREVFEGRLESADR